MELCRECTLSWGVCVLCVGGRSRWRSVICTWHQSQVFPQSLLCSPGGRQESSFRLGLCKARERDLFKWGDRGVTCSLDRSVSCPCSCGDAGVCSLLWFQVVLPFLSKASPWALSSATHYTRTPPALSAEQLSYSCGQRPASGNPTHRLQSPTSRPQAIQAGRGRELSERCFPPRHTA